VYKGFDREEGIEVAWCDIDLSDLKKSEKDRVRNEFNLWKNMNNPGLCELIDCWFDKYINKVVFITELFDGGNLKTFLKEKGLQRLSTVKKWFKSLLESIF
jgi:WNK lysine deficient protein kinase